jgi:hypothetical protein
MRSGNNSGQGAIIGIRWIRGRWGSASRRRKQVSREVQQSNSTDYRRLAGAGAGPDATCSAALRCRTAAGCFVQLKAFCHERKFLPCDSQAAARLYIPGKSCGGKPARHSACFTPTRTAVSYALGSGSGSPAPACSTAIHALDCWSSSPASAHTAPTSDAHPCSNCRK